MSDPFDFDAAADTPDARYQRSLLTGCCRKCSNQPLPGLKYCQRCRQQRRDINARRRRRLKQEGRCKECERSKAECRCGLLHPPRCCNRCGKLRPAGTCCTACREEIRAAKRSERDNRTREYQAWLAGMDATRADRKHRKRATRNRRLKNRRGRNKLLAIDHYGGCCRSCGEARAAFLNIDHIVEIGNRNRERAASTVQYVVKNGFPPGFQVLCWNCNWLKYLATKTTWRPNPLKGEVVEAYGGKCACCGLDDIRVLTVDHVNNDGAGERRALRTRNPSKLLRRLKGNGWPGGDRRRGRTCNSGRHVNGGECPHRQAPTPLLLRVLPGACLLPPATGTPAPMAIID